MKEPRLVCAYVVTLANAGSVNRCLGSDSIPTTLYTLVRVITLLIFLVVVQV